MASTRITRTLSANGDKKLTISAWIKRSKISDAQYICRVFSDGNNQGVLVMEIIKVVYILQVEII